MSAMCMPATASTSAGWIGLPRMPSSTRTLRRRSSYKEIDSGRTGAASNLCPTARETRGGKLIWVITNKVTKVIWGHWTNLAEVPPNCSKFSGGFFLMEARHSTVRNVPYGICTRYTYSIIAGMNCSCANMPRTATPKRGWLSIPNICIVRAVATHLRRHKLRSACGDQCLSICAPNQTKAAKVKLRRTGWYWSKARLPSELVPERSFAGSAGKYLYELSLPQDDSTAKSI
ncbi:hypothetical protein GGX14DRAFT_404385 [Mycena pura]|uniref:Uncharacterized protein n=1 Tax=Mycena pura TaxID=153505 RepID=A0AAD6Y7I1_9AGAR|nr:hypothetical protein GGX14DRAFT_404385 [Mycena pura]